MDEEFGVSGLVGKAADRSRGCEDLIAKPQVERLKRLHPKGIDLIATDRRANQTSKTRYRLLFVIAHRRHYEDPSHEMPTAA